MNLEKRKNFFFFNNNMIFAYLDMLEGQHNMKWLMTIAAFPTQLRIGEAFDP